MTPAEISAAIASVRAGVDIVKGLRSAAEFVKRAPELDKLYESIFSAREALLAQQERIAAVLAERDEAKKLVAQLQEELKDKSKYSLLEVSPGIYVFAFNPPEGSTEPRHWLCCDCKNKNQKSVLAYYGSQKNAVIYSCGTCQAEVWATNPMRP